MISRNYLGVTTLGDVGTTNTELVNAAMPFFVALYDQPPGTSMESARLNIFTKKKKNPKVMTSQLFYRIICHVSAVHLNLLHWSKNI